MKKNEITEYDGRGTFTDAHTLEVATADGDARRSPSTTASSPPAPPPSCCPAPRCSERVVTYEEQILADDLPESIVIAGAGAIGVEFAYVLHNYGVKVTIVEFLDRIVPAGGRGGLRRTGPALPQARHRRAHLHPGRVHRRRPAPQVRVTVTARTAQQQVLEADKVLQAIGFAPRVDRLRPGEHRRARSPSAARSTSTAAAAPTCRTSTRSATSPRS